MEEYDFIDSKFRLVILAARRAKQLVRGAKKKVDMNAENPLTVALREVEDGLINFEILNEEIEEQAVIEAVGDSEDEVVEGDDVLAALEKEEEEEDDEDDEDEDEDFELNPDDDNEDEFVDTEEEVS